MKFYLICITILISQINGEHLNDTLETLSSGDKRFTNFNELVKTIDRLLVLKKNIIAALPLEIIMAFLDKICSTTIHDVPPIVYPDVTQMEFQFMTRCQNYRVPLLQASKLWNHKQFKKTNKVVILATGWRNTIDDSLALDILWKAFACRKEVNFVVVDAASYVDTLYTWAAMNTEEIGRLVGIGLVQLVKAIQLENIHLIGHSLGAHIMGTAGQTFTQLTGKKIPRITALDPAKPCFLKEETLPGMQRGDAEFIDVIHTNPGILAKRQPIGDIDFYVAGTNPLPPGCISISCAHSRAVEYFAESVYPGNKKNFVSYKCDSWSALKWYECSETNITHLGYSIDKKKRGIFYTPVNRYAPYGTNAKTEVPTWNSLKCEKCFA